MRHPASPINGADSLLDSIFDAGWRPSAVFVMLQVGIAGRPIAVGVYAAPVAPDCPWRCAGCCPAATSTANPTSALAFSIAGS